MPKKTSATKFKYFRSIACCNVFYKCVTKIITTKLADCLPEAISNRTIVEGRQIGDNILMAHELDSHHCLLNGLLVVWEVLS
ncbi:hypothetical protein LINPERPRIM_LOCUS4979 [Linum perenne]